MSRKTDGVHANRGWIIALAILLFSPVFATVPSWQFQGEGVAVEDTKVVRMYRAEAAQGDAAAQYMLGICYYDDDGVARNLVEAVKWFRKAAAQGYANAQFFLGVCYVEGKGVARDEAEAVEWWRKAAAQGVAEAKRALQRLGY
ncbi:MAG: tetratricopeptide repeat protein [Kiritimatiellia bacterium]